MKIMTPMIRSERATNVALGLLRLSLDVATRGLLFGAYDALVHASGVRPLTGAAAWIVGMVGYDFLYYWAHRAQHRIGVLWAVHAVHHQARKFDLTVGLRVGVLNGFVLFPFSLPLAFLGVQTTVLVGITFAHALLMTWLHTERVPELGVIERVLNTPAQHRVHHSRSPEHADRNFGGIFSFWDVAFGTYAPPAPVSEYGVIAPAHSVGVVDAHVAPLRDLRRAVRHAPSRQCRRRALWGPGDVPPPTHRSFQVLIVTAAAAAVFAALRAHPVSARDVALFVLPALVVADLAFGFLHWFMDELAPRLGTFGERLSAEFRDHHVRPDVCREASAWASAFAGSLVVLPLAVGTALSHNGNRVPTFIALVLAVLLVTPEIHKWSHGARGARFAAPLQRAGLLISPAAHAAHHRSDGSAYCVVTGWWNPLLDGLGFWWVLGGRGVPSTTAVDRPCGASPVRTRRRP